MPCLSVKQPHTDQIDPEARFTGPVIVRYVDGHVWATWEDVGYRIQQGGLAGKLSTVRAPFELDFASIPRVFWRLMPPTGLPGQAYGAAAVWHDWLYAHQAVQGEPITRKQADRVFLEIMAYKGVARWRRRVMYWAVRLFGLPAWRRAGRKLNG
jgi:hypothetical protein